MVARLLKVFQKKKNYIRTFAREYFLSFYIYVDFKSEMLQREKSCIELDRFHNTKNSYCNISKKKQI